MNLQKYVLAVLNLFLKWYSAQSVIWTRATPESIAAWATALGITSINLGSKGVGMM